MRVVIPVTLQVEVDTDDPERARELIQEYARQWLVLATWGKGTLVRRVAAEALMGEYMRSRFPRVVAGTDASRVFGELIEEFFDEVRRISIQAEAMPEAWMWAFGVRSCSVAVDTEQARIEDPNAI